MSKIQLLLNKNANNEFVSIDEIQTAIGLDYVDLYLRFQIKNIAHMAYISGRNEQLEKDREAVEKIFEKINQ